ncbi:MAG: Uma2 family endonuclease, partial [Fimbriimonadales bacterium]
VGPQHAVAVALISETLTRLTLENTHVRVQLPLTLGEYDEPFPDIAVVAGSPRDYLTNHPTTALLVVEVAEASLRTDREIKGSLYAHAGVPEYWIVNLKARVVEVYREPVSDDKAIYGASYRHRQVLAVGEVIHPLCCAEASVAVERLLP